MKTFTKAVSKGTRFNQIYVSKEMGSVIEPGDLVEVRLIRKHTAMHYSGVRKLSRFKQELIHKIFSVLQDLQGIETIFIVGSFLTGKADYRDIDLVLVTNNPTERFEGSVYSKLAEKIPLGFHILLMTKEKLDHLLKICPLTLTMFQKYVSNKKVMLNFGRIVDKNHIKFLLMMPEDLLDIILNSRIFYDSIRRLIAIERFLGNKKLDAKLIDGGLQRIIGDRLFSMIKNNEIINDSSIELLRGIIKDKLKNIKGALKHGKKR